MKETRDRDEEEGARVQNRENSISKRCFANATIVPEEEVVYVRRARTDDKKDGTFLRALRRDVKLVQVGRLFVRRLPRRAGRLVDDA